MIVGIDPGQHTGIAVFESGKLWKLDTIDPFEMWLIKRESSKITRAGFAAVVEAGHNRPV